MDGALSSSSPSSIGVVPSFTKIDRRRLKKLLKRCTKQSKSGESGITSSNDRDELEDLLHRQKKQHIIHPEENDINKETCQKLQLSQNENKVETLVHIKWNCRGGDNNDQQLAASHVISTATCIDNTVTEGYHHRDMLHNLLLRNHTTAFVNGSKNPTLTTANCNQKQRKRKRKIDENNEKTKNVQEKDASNQSNFEFSSTEEVAGFGATTIDAHTNSSKPIHVQQLPNLPPWVMIQNPILAHHIAIIEIHTNFCSNQKDDSNRMNAKTSISHQQQHQQRLLVMDTINQRFCHFLDPSSLSSTSITTSTSANCSGSTTENHDTVPIHQWKVLKAKTRWYQGMKAKSLSDILMYSTSGNRSGTDTTSSNKIQKCSTDINDDPKTLNVNETKYDKGSLYVLLKELVASSEELENEGYPQNMHDTKNNNTNLITTTNSSTCSSHRPCQESLSGSDENKHVCSFVGCNSNGSSTSGIREGCSVPSLQEALECIEPYQVSEPIVPMSGSSHSGYNNDKRPKYITTAISDNDAFRMENTTQPRHYNVFALDCEMVVTDCGSELARITLIQLEHVNVSNNSKNNRTNSNSKNCKKNKSLLDVQVTSTILFDHIVKPQNNIVDYVTNYSGITADMMNQPTTLRLEQIQAMILSIIHPCDIVIGHSVENDLHALRWIHETIVDTALLFRHNKYQRTNSNQRSASSSTTYFKYSLRHLSAVLLQKTIQGPNQPHDSAIDARTALELAVKRAIIGSTFMVHTNSSNYYQKQVNCFIQQSTTTTIESKSKFVSVGSNQWLQKHILTIPNPIHVLQCDSIHSSNAKAVKAFLSSNNSNTTTCNNSGISNYKGRNVVWANFNIDVTNILKQNCLDASEAGSIDKITIDNSSNQSTTTDTNMIRLNHVLDEYEHYICNILKTCTKNTIVCVAVQHGYEELMQHYHERSIKQKPKATLGWSNDEEGMYQQRLQSNQYGMTFWITKR